MKKGISVWAFKKQPLKDVFALAKKAGYDGVELSLDEKGEVSLDSTKEDMEVVKALAKEAGIELYSVATGLYWSCFLTSAKEEIRERAKSIIKKQIFSLTLQFLPIVHPNILIFLKIMRFIDK